MLAGSIANSKLNQLTTANKVALTALDLDGGTDIGADLVDADLVIVDDGAGGTNRKSALSRMKKYIFSAVSGDATASDAGALSLASASITGQTAETSIADDDLILISDTSASGALRKMTKANFVSGLSGATAADDITAGDSSVEISTNSGNLVINNSGTGAFTLKHVNTSGNNIEVLNFNRLQNGRAEFYAPIQTCVTQTGTNILGGSNTEITGHLYPGSNNNRTLGKASNTWSDLYLGDSSILYFGNDQEIKLEHDPDDGLILKMVGSSNYDPSFVLEGDSAGSRGPKLTLRGDSASPASNDWLGLIQFEGDDSAGNNTIYSSIRGLISDTTNGAEVGKVHIGASPSILNAGLAVEGISGESSKVKVDVIGHNGSDSGLHLGGTLVTATAAELNILDGVTATAAELNILDGVTATAAELNILDGVTATASEINVLDGVTAGTVTASKALVVDANKDLSAIRNLTVDGDIILDDGGSIKEAGGTAAITIDASGEVTKIGQDTPSDGQVLTWDNSNSKVVWAAAGGSTDFTSIGSHVVPSAADTYDLGSTSGEWANLYLGDSSRIYFGNDQDVYLQHDPDDGIQMHMASESGGEPNFTIVHNNSSANYQGPQLVLHNSSADASSDLAGSIRFKNGNQFSGFIYSKGLGGASGTGSEIYFSVHPSGASSQTALSITGINNTNGTIVQVNDHNGSTTGLKLGNTLVTASGSELNKLDGVTATTAELNILDGVTATAAEINVLDGVTAGTVTASKALVVDSNKDLSAIRNLTVDGDIILDDGGSIKEAGGTAAITIDASGEVTKIGQDSPSDGQFLQWDGTNSKVVWAAASGGGGGASAPGVTSASPGSAYTISTHAGIEEIYLLTPSTAITVNLPAAASCGAGYKYQIKNLSSNTITLDPNSSETIDGSATFDISTQYSSVTVVTDGSNWFII